MSSFADIFAIEPEGDGCFRAELDGFGGLTLGCATLAAARSAPGLDLHAIHTCFLRPVPTGRPVLLRVETLSNGRRFARRRVEIEDGGKLSFSLLASFAAPSAGPELADPEPEPAPPPESLPTDAEVAKQEGWEEGRDHPFEMRWVGRPWAPEGPSDSRYRVWVQPREPLEDPALRAAAIAFMADFHSHWPVARRLGGHFEAEGYTSLDQSVWIHRREPWDDFWLYESWTESAHAGRALGHRRLRTREGLLVASMAQEALIPGGRPLP
jgi:acyl-CoA thioesterase-2